MRAIDADKLFAAFEDADWFDNADRDIAEDLLLDAPVVNQTEQPDPITGLVPCGCGGAHFTERFGGGRMTREEAARVLGGMMDDYRIGSYDNDWYYGENLEVLETAITAMRGPEWVRTADRLPEGDEHDYVLTVWRGWRGNYAWSVEPTQIGAVRLLPELYYYWMPLPKLPEEEK